MWSGIGAIGCRVVVTCAAVTAVGCGNTARNDKEPANGDAGRAGGAGNASAGRAGNGSAGEPSPGAAGAAGSLSGGGSGNFAGGSGGASPDESASWHWKACGSIEPLNPVPVDLAFAPEGDDLAILYQDGSVLLHAQESAEPKRVLRAPGTPLRVIALSGDGKYFAGAGTNFIEVQSLPAQVPVPTPDVQDCPTEQLRFSFDSDRLLAWGGPELCIWRVSDGALLHRLDNGGDFLSAALNGSRLLVSQADAGQGVPGVQALTLPGLAALTVRLEALPEAGTIEGFEISPRGDSLASRSHGVVALWSAEGRLLANRTGILQSFSPDGALVVIGDELLDASTGAAVSPVAADVQSWSDTLEINNGGHRSAALAWMAEDRNMTRVQDLRAGDQLRVYGARLAYGPLRDLAISPDGRQIAVGSGIAVLWDIAPEFADSQQRAIAHAEVQHDVDFSPASELFVSGDGWAMYSAEGTRRVERALPPPSVTQFDCMLTPLRASPNNQWLAIGEYRREVLIRAREPAQLVATIATPGCNTRVAFSKNEQYLATTGPALYRTSDWARLWPPPESDVPPSTTPSVSEHLYNDVAFLSGDTELLVSHCGQQPGPDTCRYALHSVANGALLRDLPPLRAHRASISPESHWVVSGNVLLHLPTDTVRTLDPAPDLTVFAPDGDIIGASDDGSLTRYCRTRR